ncbi:MAG: DUF3784 domain-containing protein [Sulfolobales archaeon]
MLLVLSLIFIALGFYTKHTKRFLLIAGYNYASLEEQKQKEKEISDFIANIYFAFAGVFITQFMLKYMLIEKNIVDSITSLLIITIVFAFLIKGHKLGLRTSKSSGHKNSDFVFVVTIILLPMILFLAILFLIAKL